MHLTTRTGPKTSDRTGLISETGSSRAERLEFDEAAPVTPDVMDHETDPIRRVRSIPQLMTAEQQYPERGAGIFT
ncbi:hypothetical protein C495_10889 [Natronorubrum sulfidifaciens JCM 14089]|uniref:Uncharacterized protein n=1 Tax=Natronorubrum sulfidifaciens JCM 14089 TaxID=1230460 RepID=L9W7U4_9EURY|nr:hypothetical protein C495_10889 [Natronorubrum sulfidifaciens JCM 14089]